MSAVAAPKAVTELPSGNFTQKLAFFNNQPAKPTPILQHDWQNQPAEFTLKFTEPACIAMQIFAASDSDPQGDNGARDQVIVYFNGKVMTPTDNYQWGQDPKRYEFSVAVPNSSVPWPVPADTPLDVKVVHDNKRAKARKLDVTVYQVKC